MIYLAEVSGYNLSTSSALTLYFCTGKGFIDNTTATFYEPRIEQPASMSREIFSNGQIGGASTAGYGELTLINNDGALDYLADYAFDGRSLVIRVGDENSAYSAVNFPVILKASIAQVALEWGRVSVRLKDRQAELDKPLQVNVYAGSNSLPLGLEGVSDLKASQKPKLYGRVNNVSPVLVNTSLLTYQVNDGAIAEIVNVMDKGAYLSRGTDYASQAAMEATSPTAGQFRVWPAGGYFRVGVTPAGQVTATVWESNTIEANTAAQIAYRLVTGAGGVLAVDTVATDYTTLDGQNAGSVGLYVQNGQTIADALDKISQSVGAWWGFDSLGRFRMARLDLPTGTAVATFTKTEIITIEREQTPIENNTVPAWKVIINSDVNWTQQDGGSLAGSVSADRRTWLAAISRPTSVEDAAVKTKHPTAQIVTYDTLLPGSAIATPEATRRLTMLKGESHILSITVRVDAATLALIDLGVVVSIQHNRFGLSAGKLYRVIKIQTNYQSNQLDLRLWA